MGVDALASIAGPAVAGGLSMLGGIFQQDNMSQQVQQQEQFQEHMSDTQFQRGAADLKAAGINPLLYFGADSAMPGAMYDPQNIIGNAVGSATGVAQAQSLMGLQGAQAGLAGAQANLAGAQTDLTDHQRDVMISQVLQNDATTRGIQLSNDQKAIVTKYYQDHPWLLKVQSTMDSMISPLTGAAKDIAAGGAMMAPVVP